MGTPCRGLPTCRGLSRKALPKAVHLYLASGSPRRRELLRLSGLDFTVREVEVDETSLAGEGPVACARRLALAKAQAAACGLQNGLVLGCDTIVVLGRRILGKPQQVDEAVYMLRLLSGRAHQVISGLALVDVESGAFRQAHERTRVYFRRLTEREILNYAESGEPLDKAGGYGIQGRAAFFISKIEGCYYNVMGLPLYQMGVLLKRAGMPVK